MAKSLSQDVRSRYAEQIVLEVEGAALSLFEERGVTDVTVEQIAARAGISLGGSYGSPQGSDPG